jgi:hypothetical protein
LIELEEPLEPTALMVIVAIVAEFWIALAESAPVPIDRPAVLIPGPKDDCSSNCNCGRVAVFSENAVGCSTAASKLRRNVIVLIA